MPDCTALVGLGMETGIREYERTSFGSKCVIEK